MSPLAFCYEYQVSMASQQTAQTLPQAPPQASPYPSPQASPYPSPQLHYSRRNSSPDGSSHSHHRRSHSLSGHHTYNQNYLCSERQSRWGDARQEFGLTRTLSQSRSPPRSGTIRMPVIEPGSHDDGWVMPAGRHFTPLPAPEKQQQVYHSHRRRYSIASPTLSPEDWSPSALRSISPCSGASSRRSSRSSEKRVRFAEGV